MIINKNLRKIIISNIFTSFSDTWISGIAFSTNPWNHYKCHAIELNMQIHKLVYNNLISTIDNVKINTGTEYAIFMDKSNTSIIYNLYIPNDDYTIGKIIETYLFNMFNKDIYYVSFKKEHPHDKHCYILFSYIDDDITFEKIASNLRTVSEELIKIYQNISSKF
jgi:DNA-directed RNA polymerase subunit L